MKPGSANGRLALITGGAGFIGSHTADTLLAAGYRVRVLDCLDPQIHPDPTQFPAYLDRRVERIKGDILDEKVLAEALEGASYVYHFAALTGVGQSMYEVQHYTDINVSGTASVLQVIARNKLPIERVVLSSSRAVYGEGTHVCPACGPIYPEPRRREDLERHRFDVYCPTCGATAISTPTSEIRPLSPTSVYGWTKRFQEDLCRHVCDTHRIPLTILRYFNVYGSRQSLTNPYTGIVSIFFSRLIAQQPISLYEHGLPLRDFVHISDVAQANLLAIGADIPSGRVFNVGAGVESTVRDIAQALAEAVGAAAVLQDTAAFRYGDIFACYADLEQSRKVLGFAPKTSLRDGMVEFASWAKTQRSEDLYQRTVEELSAHGLFGNKPG
jgi:dTDP-L-rhamnose 4-epimerase